MSFVVPYFNSLHNKEKDSNLGFCYLSRSLPELLGSFNLPIQLEMDFSHMYVGEYYLSSRIHMCCFKMIISIALRIEPLDTTQDISNHVDIESLRTTC